MPAKKRDSRRVVLRPAVKLPPEKSRAIQSAVEAAITKEMALRQSGKFDEALLEANKLIKEGIQLHGPANPK